MAYCMEGASELQQLIVGQLAMRGVEDAHGYFPREISKMVTEVGEKKYLELTVRCEITTVTDCTGSAAPHTALQVSGVARLMGRTDAPVQGASATQAGTTCQVSSGCEGHGCTYQYDCLLVGRHSKEAIQYREVSCVCAVQDFTNNTALMMDFNTHAHTHTGKKTSTSKHKVPWA